eukprot:RCo049223
MEGRGSSSSPSRTDRLGRLRKNRRNKSSTACGQGDSHVPSEDLQATLAPSDASYSGSLPRVTTPLSASPELSREARGLPWKASALLAKFVGFYNPQYRPQLRQEKLDVEFTSRALPWTLEREQPPQVLPMVSESPPSRCGHVPRGVPRVLPQSCGGAAEEDPFEFHKRRTVDLVFLRESTVYRQCGFDAAARYNYLRHASRPAGSPSAPQR